MDENQQARETIQQIVDRLVAGYQPERVILFGSFAYGRPDDDSDIDLLIVKETSEPPLERRVRVRRLLTDPGRRIPLSPLVVTPEELASRLASNDPFWIEIVQHGKILYGGN